MKSVILDAMENTHQIEDILKRILTKKGGAVSHFKLTDMHILPCRSCGSCGIRTPGKCVIGDDMQEIMKAIAGSNVYIMLTPVRFGGYSSQLKKVVDRTMAMGLPLYFVKDGHLLHPMRYGRKSMLVIGIAEETQPDQTESFKTLVARNALNMQFPFQTLIFKSWGDIVEIEREIGVALSEVCKDA